MPSFLIVGLVRGAAWGRDIVRTPDLTVAGVCELDAAKLARVGDELGVPAARRFTDLDRALALDADVVVLATPPPTHAELSLGALRAGHHVICEKPVTRDLAEFRSLRAAVGAFPHRFMIGEQYRFADGCENVKRAIAAGLIGRPAYVDHRFGRAGPVRFTPPPEGPPRRPHGHVYGMTIHHFDMWWYATGKRPVEIRVDPIDPPWNQSGRPLGYSMRAALDGGLHVHYLDARALARPQTPWNGDWWVVGDEGALAWDGAGPLIHHRTLPAAAGGQHLAVGPVSYVSREHRETGNSATILLARELLAAIAEGRPHQCDLDDNLVSFATTMAAIEAAETGRPVKVATE